MVKLERFNCDNCDKECAKGHFIYPQDNEGNPYEGNMFVCNDCHKILTKKTKED
jgi:hypothetical protein